MSKQQMSKQEWAAQSKARLEAAQATLEAAVAKLVTGDDWRQYLDFSAKLHNYSPNNAALLAAQHAERYAQGLTPEPTPSFMAGFGTWQQLGRRVNKGEHGYAVLAPVTYMHREARDASGESRRLAKGEQLQPGETEQRPSALHGFRVEFVFEASQTSGAPLPEVPHPKLLVGEAPEGLGVAVMELIESAGYTVDTVPDAASIQGANGQTNWGARSVVLRSDMTDAAMVKTLLHECGHVLLHADGAGAHITRGQKEVEAESVAYVVAAAHGMGTDGYSFPYVAHWAATDDPEQSIRRVRQAQSRVSTAAKLIIAASPAPHEQGGRLPAAAIQAAQAERAARAQRTAEPAPLPSDAIQVIPVGMGMSA
ncbi:MAG: ArdC-like ssDNA-binding domain-containing protein [Acidimicrobiales bacterium]